MPTVHPTAIVDPQANLADDVVIGPFCLIEGAVTIGAGTTLLSRVSLRGPLTLGQNNRIYPNTTIGYEPQDYKFDIDTDGAGVVIGNENLIRESVTIHRATTDTPTTVGDHNFLMATSHIAHDCVVGSNTMMANGAVLGGHVHLGDRAVLGGLAGIHQNVRVGRMAMVSGLAGLSQDIPPFCVSYHQRTISSLNIIGLRRANLREHVPALKTAFNIFFRESLAKQTALDRITAEVGDDPLAAEFVDFIRNSKRGITSYADSKRIRSSHVG